MVRKVKAPNYHTEHLTLILLKNRNKDLGSKKYKNLKQKTNDFLKKCLKRISKNFKIKKIKISFSRLYK